MMKNAFLILFCLGAFAATAQDNLIPVNEETGQAEDHLIAHGKHIIVQVGDRVGFPDRTVERCEGAGRVAAGLETNILALLILSLCFFPFIARPAAESALLPA